MIFEILSSAAVGGFVGYQTLKSRGMGDEGKKIARIFTNSGLTVKENGHIKTAHLQRSTKKEWGVEYAFRIPLGLSFSDFEKRIDNITDGLNGTGTFDIHQFIKAIRKLKITKSILDDVKVLLANKSVKKEVELSYNGLLIVRVFESTLPERYTADQAELEQLPAWNIIAGRTRDKIVLHDFEEHSHLIVAGSTGYGKSVFLKNIITTLVHKQPKHTRLFLMDLKGGLTFNRYISLEQTKGVAKTPEEAFEMLESAQGLMEERMNHLLKNQHEDVQEAKIKDRFFVIIDEAADLSDHKECQAIIKDIARRGRAVGFRLVYATQYPTNETISSQVRQNCSARICFRLGTGVASRAVLDEEGAEKLPLIKGRAIYKTDRIQVIQTPILDWTVIEGLIKPDGGLKNDGKQVTARREHTLIIEETTLS
ncbi:FtsK/SpoIIIE domain-containing protein [Jeotgalibacillus proteolyticus]|uniref:Cell division protein FtsK n=1 Tax=Jeotgalibacillus proteolyticus TaxID=2082395 RepID=A0A2S5GAX9_9BACL|nr:FtsK/SpoIIIE domain-containing protein [Jeotgalibacillus proteolyticus]PPA70172.1 cell division protein FtsK [Jeotgalibacillus proteolyticus]